MVTYPLHNLTIMKLTYAVRIEDFRALQPPFTTRAGKNAGFKGVLVVCTLIALLGVFLMTQGAGVPVATFLIALGFLAAGLAYLHDQRSVSKAKGYTRRRSPPPIDRCIVVSSAVLRPTRTDSRFAAGVGP